MRVASFGLDGGDGVVVGELAVEFDQHALGGAHFVFVFVHFAGRGEGAVGGVLDHFRDRWRGLLVGLLFGQVEAGDLQAVEQEAGAFGVDLVGGDAFEDCGDGLLDGSAVV
ncbi:MAG: hypothetical protein M3Y27_13290 [Acidobacteriota bacterium]|nr:hypothetical protein [Acidobacteriota bacterium]